MKWDGDDDNNNEQLSYVQVKEDKKLRICKSSPNNYLDLLSTPLLETEAEEVEDMFNQQLITFPSLLSHKPGFNVTLLPFLLMNSKGSR